MQALARDIAKRSARGGEDDAAHPGGSQIAGKTARQRLKNCVVLAVDRQQRRAVRAHRLHEYGARRNQRFLVCEQHALACLDGGETRAQAGDADDRRHYGVDLRQARDLLKGALAVQHSGRNALRTQSLFQRFGIARATDHRIRRAEFDTLAKQEVELAMGGERDDLKSFAMTCDDVERVDADAAGRAEDGELPRLGHG